MADVINLDGGEFVHLGLGATTIPLPPFTGDVSWYEDYGRRHGDDGNEGRLVSLHTFTESWDSWEMHPKGSELVVCIEGTLLLHQEHPDGRTGSITLDAGEAVINHPGVWHVADLPDGPAKALFITAGEGTQHRPR